MDTELGSAAVAVHGGAYRRFVKKLLSGPSAPDQAMHDAIGGEFEAMGVIELDLLISVGLRPDSSVVDVGCGSGRLAAPLSRYLTGPYLGTDVVPDLLDYARRLANRDDWRFEVAEGLRIPAPDSSADIVCFFSVLTHLRHEESFRYLEEAKRVSRPDGRIVFSFLEFAIPSHWIVFEKDVAEIGFDQPVNQFMSRDGIDAFARNLGLEVVQYLDGDTPNIPLSQPVRFSNGQTFTDLAPLGQSVAVLRRISPTG
ncbi:MAG TPA: class I SAM-dependent methyltransferase [Acidimicrobiales bacterium]|nr:class I SAM-dependent methyltransferase [Acidimicrobiales bacterium]